MRPIPHHPRIHVGCRAVGDLASWRNSGPAPARLSRRRAGVLRARRAGDGADRRPPGHGAAGAHRRRLQLTTAAVRRAARRRSCPFAHAAAAGDRREPARHGALHERYHQPSQRRGDDAFKRRRADRQSCSRMAVVRVRPHSALPAAAPRPRHHQRPLLRAVVGSGLRDASALRGRHRLGVHRERPSDAVHGCAHNLCQTHLGLGGCPIGAQGRAQRGVPQAATDGLRFRGPARLDAQSLEGDQRSHAAGALWDDGDRTGASRTPRARPSATAGFAPETWL